MRPSDQAGDPPNEQPSAADAGGAGSAASPDVDPDTVSILPPVDALPTWVFPQARTVVAMHRRLQSEYAGAGREQPIDPFKVSALLVEIAGIAHIADRRADAATLAACLMAACLRLRPSPVGNRRLGFALAMLFLRLNGHEFTARAEEKYTFAARFGYPGFESNVFAEWLRLRLIAQRTGAGTVVRVRTRGRRIEGVSVMRPSGSPRAPRPRLVDSSD